MFLAAHLSKSRLRTVQVNITNAGWVHPKAQMRRQMLHKWDVCIFTTTFFYHKIRSAKCRYLNLHRLWSSLWLVLVLQLETISYHLPFATLDGLPPKDIPLIGTMSPVRIAGRKKSMGFLAGFVEFEDKKKIVWKIFPPLCQSQNNIMLMKLRGCSPYLQYHWLC